jgi:putative peptidoglycan binding protein
MSRVSALKANPVVSDLAHLVVAAMERKGYQVDRGPGEVNIVYVEGMNPDGTANADEANKWNDLRLLIRFEGGEPRIIGEWAATTEPGRYWTENPMSPLGAARIEFGQYKSWQVGMHRNNHEALVQTGGEVTVCRDLNKDGQRTGDKRQTGEFGINQHWGYDLPEVEKASAGCLVGQSKDGHRQFMALVKSDPRYQANRKHVFAAAILPESEVLTSGVVKVTAPQATELPEGSVDGSDLVRRLQKLLGFSEQGQDGIFGAITEAAVKRFQRRHGLPVTGDADDQTRDQLERQFGTERDFAGPSAVEPSVESPLVGRLLQRLERMEDMIAENARRTDPGFAPRDTSMPDPTPGPDDVTPLLGRLMQRLDHIEDAIAENARRVDPGFAPSDQSTSPFPSSMPGSMLGRMRGQMPGQDDVTTLLERLVPLVERLQGQGGVTGVTPIASQAPVQLGKALDLIKTILAPGADGTPPPLGQVNGALGQTIGNLLNGKKTAIGLLGAVITPMLTQASTTTALAPILAMLTPAAGLAPFTLPIFLGLTAWGVLGKMEKWSQGTAPRPKA